MANLNETRAWASTFLADLRFNGKNGVLPYRLHLPGRYERGKAYPLVLLMHGYGSIGSDNWGQLFLCGLFANNPGVDLDNLFILAPQCPADGMWIEITDDDKWLGVNYKMSREPVVPMAIAMELLEYVVSAYPIDRKRLYVGGNSTFAPSEDVRRRFSDLRRRRSRAGGGHCRNPRLGVPWRCRHDGAARSDAPNGACLEGNQCRRETYGISRRWPRFMDAGVDDA